jgi:predicted CXXCH cytochrome family protein
MNNKVISQKALVNGQQPVKKYFLHLKTNPLYVICFLLFTIHYSLFTASVYAQTGLKEKIPDLCFKCHENLKADLSHEYVHFPFKQGKCNVCHNSHAGDLKGLMRDEINPLCLNCHEGIKNALNKNYIHQALKKGVCTDCHNAHSGENKNLLVKAQKEICWSCHESLKEQLQKTYVHNPFKGGECSSCHDPHASSEEDLIVSMPKTLCKQCHTPRCNANGVSITFATEKLDCTDCHAGHSSAISGFIGPYGHSAFMEKKCEQCHNPIKKGGNITTEVSGNDLCLICHKLDSIKINEKDIHINKTKEGCALCHNYHASKKKNLTVKESQLCFTCHEATEKRTILMERALKSIRCAPVKERKCFECHIPPHSLNALYFKADKIQTCARCHVSQHKITHPIGENVKDPRNGKPITCITCHSMHSSKAEFMLYFDRKRQLCIQCHKK